MDGASDAHYRNSYAKVAIEVGPTLLPIFAAGAFRFLDRLLSYPRHSAVEISLLRMTFVRMPTVVSKCSWKFAHDCVRPIGSGIAVDAVPGCNRDPSDIVVSGDCERIRRGLELNLERRESDHACSRC